MMQLFGVQTRKVLIFGVSEKSNVRYWHVADGQSMYPSVPGVLIQIGPGHM